MRRRHRNPRGAPPLAPPPLAALVAAALLLATLAAAPAMAQEAGSRAEAEVAFAFGQVAYHNGDFETAVAEFETATAAAPGNGTLHHWLGLAYLAQGESRRAEGALQTALDADESPAAGRQRVLADLERARGQSQGEALTLAAPDAEVGLHFGDLPPWEVRLSLGYGEDDNPLLLDDGVIVQLPGGEFVVGPQSDDVLLGTLRADVRAFTDRNGWTLGLRGEIGETRYGDLDFLDQRSFSATATLTWGGDPGGFVAGPLGYTRVPFERRPVSFAVQGSWRQVDVDGEGFLTSISAGAALTVNEGASAATVVTGAWSDLDYDVDGSDAFERSGSELSAGIDQMFYFGRRDRSLSIGVGAWQRDAGAAFDASSLEARAALALPIGRSWALRFGAARESIEFDELESNPLFEQPFADQAREETRTRWSASLSWAATDRLVFSLRGRWIDREADFGEAVDQLVDLDYERAVLTANVSWYLMGGGAR